MLRLTDLREILRYVPRFRDRVFVIALDGAIVEDENFRNLLLDIALLRSLRIGVALVHGAAHQIRRLAEQTGHNAVEPRRHRHHRRATLQLALTAANRVIARTPRRTVGRRPARRRQQRRGRAPRRHPAGRRSPVHRPGRARRHRLLQALLESDIVPVIPPLGCDGEGNSYRLNSDAVAVEVARALQAVKLIYLTTFHGIRVRTSRTAGGDCSGSCRSRRPKPC